MRILISGFEAFGGDTINPTHLLIEELQGGRIAIPPETIIDTLLLPVGFENAFEVLRARIEKFRPDVVLALGQAGGRDAIEFERVAINLIDAEVPDNNGLQPQGVPIDPEGPVAFFSTLPVRELADDVIANGISARISNSAGLYVCNFLFYKLQHYLSKTVSGPDDSNDFNGSNVRSGFIHFPYLPEKAVKHPAGTASMPLETMKRALAVIVTTIRK